jgi:tetratricopeptide (TPR) repeat protein
MADGLHPLRQFIQRSYNKNASNGDMPRLKKATLVVIAFECFCLESCLRSANQYIASGEQYFKAGKYQEAVIQFRNAIQRNPGLAEPHYRLALTYLQLSLLPDAYQQLEQTITLDPSNLDAQLQLGELQIIGKKYDEAKAIATRIVAANPENARAHAILGDQYAFRQDWQNAIKEFRLAIKLAPGKIPNYAALGAVYMSSGQLAEAEAVNRRAVEANPRSAEAHMNLGKFEFSQRKFDEAESEMRTAVAIEPSATPARLLLIEYYVVAGKLAEAEKVCIDLKAMAPDEPAAYRALGVFYGSTGKKEKAVKEFRSLMASKPKDRVVKTYLTETLLDLNRTKEATVLTEDILRADPNDAEVLISKGRILMSEGKYQDALGVLGSAVKSDHKSAAGYYYLGVAQKFLGQVELAKSSFAQAHELSPEMIGAKLGLAELEARNGDYSRAQRLMESNPDAPLASVLSGQAALAEGNLRRAEELAQHALDRDPVSLPALELLLKVDATQDRTQDAARRISGLISQHPEDASLHFLLAEAYFDMKDLQKSEASVRKAIDLDPRTPDAHALLARIDYAKGSLEQSILDLQAELDITPSKRVSTYMGLGIVYQKKGDWENARKVAEMALAADPSSSAAANNLAYLYLEHGGDVNTAVSLAQRAKRGDPDSPAVADTLGWAFYKSGSPEQAITQFKLCLQKSPENPVYQFHMGMAYLAGGHFDSAERFLQKAIRNSPHLAEDTDIKEALFKIASRARE